jgi:hypothetical protein
MNNGVGYARPARFSNPIALGTDGIGADMFDEFRVAFVAARAEDVLTTPDTPWEWLAQGWALFPDALADRVTWSYQPLEPWHLAYTPTVRAIDVDVDGEAALRDGVATRVDADEVRAKVREQAQRLFTALR